MLLEEIKACHGDRRIISPMEKQPMWAEVLEKLERLKAIDKQCQAFGARTHRYILWPCLRPEEIEGVEQQLGVGIPEHLRLFYLEAGNGGAGPNYGLLPAAKLRSYRADQPYPGIEKFRQAAEHTGEGYFEAPKEVLAGLLVVIDQGCGHESCLVTTGPLAGNVVHVSNEGFVDETNQTLRDHFEQWLDREINLFGTVEFLMRSGASYAAIHEKMVAEFEDWFAGSRISSLANVEKPARLFGTGDIDSGSGAAHNQWYEKVLKKWQRANVPSSRDRWYEKLLKR